MLSAPGKSAKRISSLFNLGSHKDDASSLPPPPSSRLTRSSREPSPSNQPRHVSSPGLRASPIDGVRTGSATPGSANRFDLEAPLQPPPSLLDVNQDLVNSPPGSPDARPRSRGRAQAGSRPGSSGGLSVRDQSRSATPSSNPRRSWIPGFSRPTSVDMKSAAAGGAPPPAAAAWIAGLEQKVTYDLDSLSRGGQVRGKASVLLANQHYRYLCGRKEKN